MALLKSLVLLSITQSLLISCQTLPTWPSPVNDELEDIMYLSTGYRARGFADPVTPCSKQSRTGTGPGRVAAAGWLRTAFHDVANTNQVRGLTGGIDASIVYELGRSENEGSQFVGAITDFEPFFGPRAPMAELIAIGTYTSVRSCGGLPIPIRLGRADAIVAGTDGQIPQPQNKVGTFVSQFSRLNMGPSEMVQLVACGHTLGGVHANNFPLIVTQPNTFQTMDSTGATPAVFDQRVASEFVAGTTTNPLVVGPCIGSQRCSDTTVNSADGNATITQMADLTYFQTSCKAVLQKMIECVPGGAKTLATNPLTPYEVKPYALSLYLQDAGGSALTFSGDIRVRTTNRPQSSIASVSLVYKDRSGNAGSTSITTTFTGTAAGLDDTFAFYSFKSTLPSTSSISSFTVQVSYTSGNVDTFTNNGAGFPVSDTLLLQYPQSCSSDPSTITVTAAVRNSISGTPNLNFLGRTYTSPIIVPKITTTTTALNSASLSVGPYTLYSITTSLNTAQSAKGYFNITIPGVSGAAVDLALLSSLPTACTTTTESCAAFCSTYEFFGTEYGAECYCGGSLTYNTTLSESSCNMACSGNSAEKCGGPGALSLYRNNLYVKPSYPDVGTGWKYSGCYTDDVGNRTVQGYRVNDDKLTLGSCASVCDRERYGVMGTEYYSECYCGAALGGTGIKVDDVQCDTVCSGNGAQSCGGAGYISVYMKGTTSQKSRRWEA
ncbi:putative fungistatic metabolite [Cyphellophora attinorum]|uniref:Putative fungistatic metabolite n=1 Tax=Cyphellophora attinorum TaxID=1664694 RepID=A0A0N1NZX1_9EURO|nr:putative fungistatic metabolite [Phialophora attinorum]KPI42280.1 putative fungistatic metabolite [Phialophora attinorum]